MGRGGFDSPTVFVAGMYPYRDDLLALDGCRTVPPVLLPPGLSAIVTPLWWEEWQRRLADHQDRVFVDWVVTGIRKGFRVGFQYGSHHCKKATRNMASARQEQVVVCEYLAKKCAEGRVLGPFAEQMLPQLAESAGGGRQEHPREMATYRGPVRSGGVQC